MSGSDRLSTGIPRLDDMLGGGIVPGALTVVLGATGIGKTQLGVQFARAGRAQEGEHGIFFDVTSRGDSQNHAEYAARIAGWHLSVRSADEAVLPESVWDRTLARCDYLHVFERSGRRVTRDDLDADSWRAWKTELARKLDRSIAFFYGNFIHGVRRCVIDGVEPVDRESDSFQFRVFDYVYHQILGKEADWVARDLFRAGYRANADRVDRHWYDRSRIGCMLLCTSKAVMLEELLTRPLDSGDVQSNANTIILMGKVREEDRMARALHIAKHRGSACDERVVPFEVTEQGITL